MRNKLIICIEGQSHFFTFDLFLGVNMLLQGGPAGGSTCYTQGGPAGGSTCYTKGVLLGGQHATPRGPAFCEWYFPGRICFITARVLHIKMSRRHLCKY